jgi:hypothetical protein
MRRWSRVIPLLLALSAAGAALSAQTPRGLVEVSDESGRRGFWLMAGLGAGAESYDLRDGLGYSSTLTEPTVSLALGGTVGRHWRLGGETLVWFHDINGGTESLASFLLIGQWYPVTRAGLFLKGGAGLGRNGTDFNNGYGFADVGFAALAGAGYEIPLTRHLALVPEADFAQHFYSGDRTFPGYRERLLHFGVGIAFQTGR